MGDLGFSIAIFFLYAKLFGLGRYWVTVGGVFVPFFLLNTIVVNRGGYRYLPQLGAMCGYPLLVYLAHVAFGTVYAVPLGRFLLSYSLWLVSMTVIWCGFQPRTILRDVSPTRVLHILLALSAFQFLGLQFFHVTLGYDIIQPISINDFYSGYMDILKNQQVRAVGSYYEPSMLGRVVVTLAMMLYFRQKSIVRFLVYSLAGFFLSKSFVVIVFMIATTALIVGLVKRHLMAVILLFVVTITVAIPAFENRLGRGTDSIYGNSTMIRMVLPVYVLSQILPEYPYGVPIGSNETVVEQTTWQFRAFTEPKITNGFYELIMYFGVCTAIPLSIVGWATIQSLRKKDLSMAIAFLYLTVATAASGSYLGIESSLLIALFTISMRRISVRPEWQVQECKVSHLIT